MKNSSTSKTRTPIALTKPQRDVLRAIRDNMRHLSPTYMEVAKIVGCSKTNVRQLIALLCKKGMLATTTERYRNLIVTAKGARAARSNGKAK